MVIGWPDKESFEPAFWILTVEVGKVLTKWRRASCLHLTLKGCNKDIDISRFLAGGGVQFNFEDPLLQAKKAQQQTVTRDVALKRCQPCWALWSIGQFYQV